MITLAGPAWGDLAQWVGCEITSPVNVCRPRDWAYPSNWSRQGLPQQPPTLGPPRVWDVVRVAPDSYGTTTINYVDTKSFILNGKPATPIFDSLSIQGVAVNHSGAADSMRTVTLTIGDGGKYTFDSATGGVGIGGTTGSGGRSSAVIGAINRRDRRKRELRAPRRRHRLRRCHRSPEQPGPRPGRRFQSVDT